MEKKTLIIFKKRRFNDDDLKDLDLMEFKHKYFINCLEGSMFFDEIHKAYNNCEKSWYGNSYFIHGSGIANFDLLKYIESNELYKCKSYDWNCYLRGVNAVLKDENIIKIIKE